MIRVLVAVGLPASGKTTFLKKIAMHHVYSPDLRLFEQGVYCYSPERLTEAWRTEYRDFGKDLIRFRRDTRLHLMTWDATFVSQISRSAIVNIAVGMDHRVDALYFDTPTAVCIHRNEERSDDRRIPSEKMEIFVKQLQPPTRAEGFRNVLVVNEFTAEKLLKEINDEVTR